MDQIVPGGRHLPSYHHEDSKLPELLLYFGNDCNRDCHFCCVEGHPGGTFRAFPDDLPEWLMQTVRSDGRIKYYGGEPTLYQQHLNEITSRLRCLGFKGSIRIYSNGVQADRLIQMLESDPPREDIAGSETYLNYYVWHGLGVKGVPPQKREKLNDYARNHPNRLWLSHEDIIPVGAAETFEPEIELDDTPPAFGNHCARCYPTVKSDGIVHACAFAAEERAPQYVLGRIGDNVEKISKAYGDFLHWVDTELEPHAARLGESPCSVCLRWARESTDKSGDTVKLIDPT